MLRPSESSWIIRCDHEDLDEPGTVKSNMHLELNGFVCLFVQRNKKWTTAMVINMIITLNVSYVLKESPDILTLLDWFWIVNRLVLDGNWTGSGL